MATGIVLAGAQASRYMRLAELESAVSIFTSMYSMSSLGGIDAEAREH
jgi:hypothetical protein